MTELVPINSGLTPWTYDVERLVERWREGRSPQTLRAYTSDLQNFAAWMMVTTAGSAIHALLRMGQGEANELVRAYRSAMVDQGVAPATSTGACLRCARWSRSPPRICKGTAAPSQGSARCRNLPPARLCARAAARRTS
jgi:hypothetical protein